MTMQYKLLPLLLIASTLLMGGCKKAETAPDAPVENSVAEGDESTEAQNEPELPKADYWKPLASHLAGSYSGNCKATSADAKREPATIVIASDAKYTFKEFSGDLRTSTQALFTRKRNADGSASLNTSFMWDDGLLGLMSNEKGDGYSINFAKTLKKEEFDLGNTFACDPSTGALAIAGKPLYTIFASVMETAPGKLLCALPGSMLPTSVPYKFKDGVFEVGAHKFDVTKMDEHVNIGEGFEQFLYTAMAEGDQSVSLGLDEHGKVMMMAVMGKPDNSISCQKDVK